MKLLFKLWRTGTGQHESGSFFQWRDGRAVPFVVPSDQDSMKTGSVFPSQHKDYGGKQFISYLAKGLFRTL